MTDDMPDPADTCVTTHYTFLLREVDGCGGVRRRNARPAGCSRSTTSVRLREQAGFRPDRYVIIERTDEDREPRRLFVGHRPNMSLRVP